MMFALLYVQHGGSGIPGLQYDHILELSLDEVEWYVERLEAQRAREAAAIRAANRTR